MAPGGGTSTSTSVFNMVLNTVGASGFASALTSAQNGINGVVSSLNKAGAAAASGRVNSELQAAAYDKMNTSILRSQASLDIFRTKIMEHAQSLQQDRDQAVALQITITDLTQRLTQQQEVLSNLDPTSRGYAGRLTQITEAIQNTKSQLSGYQTELTDVNQVIEKGTQKEALYQAQLAAREARIKASTIAMEQAKAPLTGFESALATLMQVYSGVERVTREFDKLTLTIQRVQRIWNNFKEIASGVTGGAIGGGGGSSGGNQASMIEAAIAPEMALGQAVMDTAGKFSLLGQAAATAIGQGFVDLVETAIGKVQELASGLVDLGKQGVTAAGDAERYNMSLRAMIAVQKVEHDQTLSITEAMAQSQQQASALYDWTIKLGILSPFFIETAKTALQSAVAMGFNTAAAMELTQATFDWGAATGKSSEQVQSVVQMLGQMNSIGTFNGRILRQLAIGGITVGNIFNEMAKQTGKTVAQLKEMEAQGQITATMGIDAILAFMHKFDGAAKAQAGTINGLITSLQSMGSLFVQKFFGPMDEVTGKIHGIAGAVQKELQGIVDFLQQDWVPMVVGKMGTALGGLADQAFAWGNNVVTQFAQGMLSAFEAILDAVTSIANYIAYWLSPGSPPKILPDIGKWGQSAINEFFKGFSQGDFSLFSGIGDTIEKHLRAVLVTQPSDKIGILNNIFGERQAVSAAVAEFDKTGRVAESTFQRIFAMMGGATTETQNYIRTSVALESQNKKVTAAQQALDDVTKKYDDLLRPVDEKVQSLTNAQDDLAAEQQKTMLALVLKDPNATLAEKARARIEIDKLSAQEKQRSLVAEAKKEVDTAQAKVDAETAKQKALQNTLELQKSILSAEDSQVALMQEYYDLMKEIANAGSQAGGGGGGPKPQNEPKPGTVKFPKAPPILEPKWLTDLEDKLKKAWAAIQAAFKNIDKTLEPVKKAFDRLKDAVHDLWVDFLLYLPMIELWIGQLAAWTIQKFSKDAPVAIKNLEDAVKNLQGIWDKNHLIIMTVAVLAWTIVFSVIMGVIIVITLLIKVVTAAFNFDWVAAWNKAIKVVQGFLNFFAHIGKTWLLLWLGIIDMVFGIIGGAITGNWGKLIEGWLKVVIAGFELLRIAFVIFTGLLHVVLSTFFGKAYADWVEFVGSLHQKWNTKSAEIKTSWDKFWDDGKEKLQTTVGEIIGSVTKWFIDMGTKISGGVADILKQWNDFWRGDKESMKAKVNEGIAEILKNLGTWFTDLEKAIGGEIPNLVTAGENMIKGLIDGAGNYADALIAALLSPITNAIDQAKRLLNMHSPSQVMADQIGKPMAQGIVMGLLGESDNIQKAMQTLLMGSVGMVGGPGMAGAGSNYSSSQTTNFNYNPTYNSTPGAVSDNFALMQSMVV